MTKRPKPVVLCILDGWGYRPETADNAIARAETPVYDRLLRTVPHALLKTCGTDVGLPGGQMGNSEVGHLNIGAGRIVNQEIRRIDAAIEDGSIGANPALQRLIARLSKSGGVCHLMGLLSPGGVHAHQDHIATLAEILSAAGLGVRIHAFLDGRDMPPSSALGCMETFLKRLDGLAGVSVATVMGRYYAMDRDKRWDRVARAHGALIAAEADRQPDALSAIRQSYEAGVTDEFVLPVAIGDYDGMNDGDALIMANFRADRAREILAALIEPDFAGFGRRRTVSFCAATGMVSYSADLDQRIDALFPPLGLTNILGEIISRSGYRQLRIAETEKYAHVTFFFNGGIEQPFEGEERVLVPSPNVATYDLAPEMSAGEVTDRLVEAIAGGTYDFILVNYANPDMVGHTGILDAATAAIETVDRCLGRLESAVVAAGGVLVITADHGNAETMRDDRTGEPHTAHTLNTVPILLVNGSADMASLSDGRLSDVAPTVLALMDLPKPRVMTGHSLLPKSASMAAAE